MNLRGSMEPKQNIKKTIPPGAHHNQTSENQRQRPNLKRSQRKMAH